MKGIELGTLKRMSEVIAEVAGCAPDRVAVVSGPNLAARDRRRAARRDRGRLRRRRTAAAVQQAIATRYFRPYTNDDVVGCELGGAVKNVIALACGMADGLGFGDNTRATLITRGLAETARLGVGAGRRPADLRRAGRPRRPGGDLLARRCRATVRSASSWAAARRWSRRRRPTAADRRGREELPVDPGPGPARTAWRCRSPKRSSGSATRGSTRAIAVAGADEPGDEAGVTLRGERGDGDGTRVVHAGRPGGGTRAQPFLPGPVFAAPYHLDPAAGPQPGVDAYGRTDNPTWRALEAAVGELEGGRVRRVFASGTGGGVRGAADAGPAR